MVPEEDRVPKDNGMAPVGAGAATGTANPQEAEVTTQVWAPQERLGGIFRMDQMNKEKEK